MPPGGAISVPSSGYYSTGGGGDRSLDIQYAASLGDVTLGEGEVVCTDEVDIDEVGVTISGAGRNLTTVKNADGSTAANLFDIAADDVTLQDFTVDGNKAGASGSGMGIRVRDGVDGFTFRRGRAKDCVLDGVYVEPSPDETLAAAASNVTLDDVETADCDRSNAAVVAVNGMTVTDFVSDRSAINGLNFELGPFADVLVDGFTITDSARHGISVRGLDEATETSDIVVRNGLVKRPGDTADDAGVRFRYVDSGSIENVQVCDPFDHVVSVSLSGTVAESGNSQVSC